MRRLGIDARKLADFGIGTYLQGLLAELARLDEASEVVLFVLPEDRHLLPDLPERWRLIEVDASGYTIKEQITMPFAALRARLRVLHLPHYVIPLAYPGRVVVTIHDIIHVLFPEFLPNTLALVYARFFIRQAVRRARRVIAVSETTARDLRRLFGASRDRIQVVPNGVHEEFLRFPDAGEDESLLARLGVPGPYLLHAGNYKPHKNVESVLKAYQLLRHEGTRPVPPLVLAGAFEPDGPMAHKARAMGLGGHVHCLGHLERRELAALYRGATIFVYPTLYEGFGLPVLEAMASGTPVVAGNVAAVREVAGDAVVRVNPRDVLEIASAIRRMLDKPERQAELAERGRARAAHYHWRRTAEATLAVYRAIAEER